MNVINSCRIRLRLYKLIQPHHNTEIPYTLINHKYKINRHGIKVYEYFVSHHHHRRRHPAYSLNPNQAKAKQPGFCVAKT